jgi:hypothetical protein
MTDLKKLDKAIKKCMLEEWAAEANSMKLPEIKEAICKCEGNIVVIDQALEDDEDVVATKLLLKTKTEPYKESKAVQNTKIKYLVHLMEEQGVKLDNRSDTEEEE